MGTEVWEGERKSRIIPSFCYPSCVMNEAKRTQRFDQLQARQLEAAHFLVTFQHDVTLSERFGIPPGNQQPEVLNRWTRYHVIEIQKKRPILIPEKIA